MKPNFSSSAANFGLPRTLSTGLKAKILFGNVLAFMGIIFFFSGMVQVIIFGSQVDFSAITDGEKVTASATITSFEATKSAEDNSTIMRYGYAFTAADGKQHRGESYYPGDLALRTGDTISVEYAVENPESSHLAAMPKSPFSGWIILPMLIFPVVGLVMFIIAFRKGRKNIKLVENGYLTKGKVTAKERTNVRINNRYVYKIFFEFTAADGTVQKAVGRTHKIEHVLDETEETLVFDSNNPSHAMLVDALPKAVRTYFEKMESGV